MHVGACWWLQEGSLVLKCFQLLADALNQILTLEQVLVPNFHKHIEAVLKAMSSSKVAHLFGPLCTSEIAPGRMHIKHEIFEHCVALSNSSFIASHVETVAETACIFLDVVHGCMHTKHAITWLNQPCHSQLPCIAGSGSSL